MRTGSRCVEGNAVGSKSGPLAVVAEKRVFWECPGKYRTRAHGARGGRVAACRDRFTLEQVSAAVGARGGEERGEDDHGEARRGACEGARSRGEENHRRRIGPRIGGPALPALAQRGGARARCGVEHVAEDGAHGGGEGGRDGGHRREAVRARRRHGARRLVWCWCRSWLGRRGDGVGAVRSDANGARGQVGGGAVDPAPRRVNARGSEPSESTRVGSLARVEVNRTTSPRRLKNAS